MLTDEKLLEMAQNEIDIKVQAYKGVKVSTIKKEILELTLLDNKASFVELSKKMLSLKSNQFFLCDEKIDAVLKTIRITGNEKPAESMSFMPIDFQEWVSCGSWEDNSLYRYFKKKTLVLFIFQQYPLGQRVADDEMTFLDAVVWKMTDYDINNGLKEVWEEVCRLINTGELEITPTRQKSGKIINKNNLPSAKFNYLGHLRPGGVNGEDKTKLPTGQYLVKQRFWFNKEYVNEIIER